MRLFPSLLLTLTGADPCENFCKRDLGCVARHTPICLGDEDSESARCSQIFWTDDSQTAIEFYPRGVKRAQAVPFLCSDAREFLESYPPKLSPLVQRRDNRSWYEMKRILGPIMGAVLFKFYPEQVMNGLVGAAKFATTVLKP